MRYPLAFSLLTLWTLVLCFLGWSLWNRKEADQRAYREIVEKGEGSQPVDLLSSEQHRTRVCKELWSEQIPPSYLRIESNGSHLSLHRRKGALDVVEHLEGVRAFLQEGGTTDQTPTAWFLEAERAQYHYHTQQLIAEKVHLWRYPLPQGTVSYHREDYSQQSPLFVGETPSLELSLRDQKWDIHSKQFHAEFPLPEEVAW